MNGEADSIGSPFENVELAPADLVFGLVKEFKEDQAPDKVNLIVGAYRTEEGKPFVLPVVRKVELDMANDKTLDHEYLPIEGMNAMCEGAVKLALGDDCKAITENRVCAVQTLSGTGSLRIAFEFISQNMKQTSTVAISNPTWNNHKKILLQTGFKPEQIKEYRYYNPETKGLNLAAMLDDLRALPLESTVLLHTCAHNPSGVDPTQEEWNRILQVCKERRLFPVFDTAYQGYVTGSPDVDAWPLRHFVNNGMNLICCSSFAKIFGLYNERCGNLLAVCSNPTEALHVKSQLKAVIRPMYSNPPNHGARIVATILNNAALKAEWLDQLTQMADRITRARELLYQNLKDKDTGMDWSHIINQRGMFTYTGLNGNQVNMLKQNHHIFMLPSGRISMCGITPANVEKFASAVQDVIPKDV